MASSAADFDRHLEQMDGFGRYQKLHLALLLIPACLLQPFNNYNLVFLTHTPSFNCNQTTIGDAFAHSGAVNSTDGSYYSDAHSSGGLILDKLEHSDLEYFNDSLVDKEFHRNQHVSPTNNSNSSFVSPIDSRMLSKGGKSDQCTLPDSNQSCEHFNYDQSLLQSTLVTDFNLVCDRSIYVVIMTYIAFLTGGVGLLLLSTLQDWIGRKPVFFIVITMIIAGQTLASQMPDPLTFSAARAVSDLACAIPFSNAYVWTFEILGSSRRTLASIVICACFAIGTSSLSGVAYVTEGWRLQCLVTGLPFLFLYCYYWILEESPRWLHSRGRLKECQRVVNKIQKFNRQPPIFLPTSFDDSETVKTSQQQKLSLSKYPGEDTKKFISPTESDAPLGESLTLISTLTPNDSTTKLINSQRSDDSVLEEKFPPPEVEFAQTKTPRDQTLTTKPGNFDKVSISQSIPDESYSGQKTASSSTAHTALSLLRTPNLRRKTLLLAVGFIANSMVYIGIAFNSGNLGGNFLITFALQAAIEVPAVLCNVFLLARFGRVVSLGTLMLASGTCCLLAGLPYYYDIHWLLILLSVSAKFFISMSFAVIYQLATETFPTQARASGVGLVKILSAAANTLTPFVIQTADYVKVLPMMIIGSLALFAGILVFCLPETKDQLLPETVQEAEEYGQANIATMKMNISQMFVRK